MQGGELYSSCSFAESYGEKEYLLLVHHEVLPGHCTLRDGTGVQVWQQKSIKFQCHLQS